MTMVVTWPEKFARLPLDDPWVASPIDESARQYDAVANRGWYRNLDPTLDDLQGLVGDGDIVVDYSAGTGIFAEQFFQRNPNRQVGLVLVDASPKFLRLALDKLGADERIAIRWLRYLKEEKRLQSLEEILPTTFQRRGVDALCSTNAIHLYYGLPDTLRSWMHLLRPGAVVLIQSGNIDNPNAPEGSWIIDQTVERLQPLARELVRTDPTFAPFRTDGDDPERMAAYDELRKKYFLPVRPLGYYLDALRDAGFAIEVVREQSVQALVSDWTDFLSAYHEGVLGWAGGSQRIDGAVPSDELVALRVRLLGASLAALFEHRPSFEACWTYITCRKPAGANGRHN